MNPGPAIPYKFTDAVRAELLEYARAGLSQRTSAERCKLSPNTLSNWLTATEPQELVAFAEEYRAAFAQYKQGLHQELRDDAAWQAKRFLLEVAEPETYAPRLGKFGMGDGFSVDADLSENQIEWRMEQAIAHPTKRMLDVLGRAVPRGNSQLRALILECVKKWEDSDAITVDGAPQLPAPEALVDVTERLARFLDVCAAHDRVVLAGGPKTGKTTTFAAAVSDRPIVHTDDYICKDWNIPKRERWAKAMPDILAACEPHTGKLLLEGVRGVGAIRAGLGVDILVWLRGPLVPLREGQVTQTKGREADFEKLLREQPGLKHEVI